MKRFCYLGVFLLWSWHAQAATEHRVFGLIGPQSGYRGYDVWVKLEHSWAEMFAITAIDPASDIITAPGHDFVNGESVRVVTDGGTLPSVISAYRNYFVCNVNGAQFKLVPNSTSCTGVTLDLTNAGTGVLKIGRTITPSSMPLVFLKNITLPPGMTLTTVNCFSRDCVEVSAGKFQGGTHFYVQLAIGPTAPLTLSSISVTIETSGYADRTMTLPFTPAALTPVTLARPSSYPAVPNKANWEAQMTTLGALWCDKSTGSLTNGVLSYGQENQIWYYDGAWVYNQVADYTGDTQWNNCALSISSWYRDLAGAARGGILAFRTFTDGLKRQCSTCEGRYKSVIKLIAENMALALSAGDIRDDTMRETSYALEANMNAARAFGYMSFADIPTTGTWQSKRDNIRRGANQLLGMLHTVRGPNFIYQQTFMFGLAMRALISYYDFTEDPRIPVEVKATLDYIWTQCWNRSDLFPAYANKMLYINADAVSGAMQGPRCDYNCRNTNQPASAETTLVNLTVPAFAWYWSITGDSTYQTRGDAIFSHTLDAPINFSGKIFNENFRWGIAYVNWREGRPTNRP